MPKALKKIVKKAVVAKPRVRKIEAGETVIVTTVYKVKRVVEQGSAPGGFVNGCTTMVTCEDKYADRVVTFRMEELKLTEET